jgi:hypothetical protein
MNTRSAHPSRLHPPLRGANGSLASVLATHELHMKNAQPRFRSCSDFCIFASDPTELQAQYAESITHAMCDDDTCECPCHEVMPRVNAGRPNDEHQSP